MKQKSIAFAGILCAVFVLALGCSNGSTSSSVPGSDITWTLQQVGGQDGVTDSTHIKITFDKTVESLAADQIELTSGAELAGAPGQAEANSWNLPVTVSSPGSVWVTITKDGVESGPQSVVVQKRHIDARHPSGRHSLSRQLWL